jgi:hypothetical protein
MSKDIKKSLDYEDIPCNLNQKQNINEIKELYKGYGLEKYFRILYKEENNNDNKKNMERNERH